jgi:transcriptional regulator with XRE-family HTH domain
MNIKKSVNELSLGEFLKAHRIGEEFSQTAFARQLGISKQRLCDIERNRSPVSLSLAKSLAKKLDLPPEWLAKLALTGQIKKAGLKLRVV